MESLTISTISRKSTLATFRKPGKRSNRKVVNLHKLDAIFRGPSCGEDLGVYKTRWRNWSEVIKRKESLTKEFNDAAVEIIANGGFFGMDLGTKRNDIMGYLPSICCYECGLRLEVPFFFRADLWEIHAQLKPHCYFLKSRVSQFYIDKVQHHYKKTDKPEVDYSDVSVRLSSFLCWPYQQDPEVLSGAGLSYIGEDQVSCHKCFHITTGWANRENPIINLVNCHSINGDCPFVLATKKDKAFLEEERKQYTDDLKKRETLKLYASAKSWFPMYETPESRKKTFDDIPMPEGVVQTSEDFVRAGFFRKQNSAGKDIVTCYACGKEMFGWQPYETPIAGHRKHSETCAVVITNNDIVAELVNEVLLIQKYIPTDEQSNIKIFDVQSRCFTKGSVSVFYEKWMDRVMTYGALPINIVQTPEQLASVGLVFLGVNPSGEVICVCCSCGVELSGWLEGDNPWNKHNTEVTKLNIFCPIVEGRNRKETAEAKQLADEKRFRQALKYEERCQGTERAHIMLTDRILKIMSMDEYSLSVVYFAYTSVKDGYTNITCDDITSDDILNKILEIENGINAGNLDEYVYKQICEHGFPGEDEDIMSFISTFLDEELQQLENEASNSIRFKITEKIKLYNEDIPNGTYLNKDKVLVINPERKRKQEENQNELQNKKPCSEQLKRKGMKAQAVEYLRGHLNVNKYVLYFACMKSNCDLDDDVYSKENLVDAIEYEVGKLKGKANIMSVEDYVYNQICKYGISEHLKKELTYDEIDILQTDIEERTWLNSNLVWSNYVPENERLITQRLVDSLISQHLRGEILNRHDVNNIKGKRLYCTRVGAITLRYPNMCNFNDRLSYFPEEFSRISAQLMAKAGFFYWYERFDYNETGQVVFKKPKLVCHCCGLWVSLPTRCSDIYQFHASYKPHCEFLITLVTQDYIDKTQKEFKAKDYDIRHDYSDACLRLASFACWPSYKTQDPQDLAYSGLYYMIGSSGDEVCCWVCGVSIPNWADGEQPWDRHFKASPKCSLACEQIEARNQAQVKAEEAKRKELKAKGYDDFCKLNSKSNIMYTDKIKFVVNTGYSLLVIYYAYTKISDNENITSDDIIQKILSLDDESKVREYVSLDDLVKENICEMGFIPGNPDDVASIVNALGEDAELLRTCINERVNIKLAIQEKKEEERKIKQLEVEMLQNTIQQKKEEERKIKQLEIEMLQNARDLESLELANAEKKRRIAVYQKTCDDSNKTNIMNTDVMRLIMEEYSPLVSYYAYTELASRNALTKDSVMKEIERIKNIIGSMDIDDFVIGQMEKNNIRGTVDDIASLENELTIQGFSGKLDEIRSTHKSASRWGEEEAYYRMSNVRCCRVRRCINKCQFRSKPCFHPSHCQKCAEKFNPDSGYICSVPRCSTPLVKSLVKDIPY